MSQPSEHLTRLRQWLRAWLREASGMDALLALAERSHAGLRQLALRVIPDALATPPRPKKKRSHWPTFERLETRFLMTTVQLSSSTVSVGEVSGYVASMTVSLNAPSPQTITVQYATSNGTATAGTDYTAASGTLTFAPGTQVQFVGVPILYSSTYDGSETFNFTLSSPTNASLGSPAVEVVGILDSTSPPTVEFSTTSYSVSESGGSATVTANLSAAAGITATVHYATSDASAHAGNDYTATSGTLTFAPGQTSATFSVPIIDHKGPYPNDAFALSLSSPSVATLGTPGTASMTILGNDASQLNYTGSPPQGKFGVSPGAGNLVKAIQVDTGVADGTCGCGSQTLVPNGKEDMGAVNAVASVTGNPSFVYDSDTADAQPILYTYFQSRASDPVPTAIKVGLTFNGVSQATVTYATTGHSAGDTYALAAQVSSALTSTGRYGYTLTMEADYASAPTLVLSTTGSYDVVVNSGSSPIGAGWSLGTVDRLVAVTGGVLWVAGSGGSAFFAGSSGTLTNASDPGTLVKNGDGSYTYTRSGYTYSFNSAGLLTTIQSPGGAQTRTYTYSGSNLTGISEPDGYAYTFAYTGSQVSTVSLLGGRTVTLTHDGSGQLTGMAEPNGQLLTFGYDTAHRLVSDNETALVSFSYDSVAGKVNGVDMGGGDHWTVKPGLVQALGSTAINSAAAVGTFTDPLSQPTTYALDAQGRVSQRTDSGGLAQSWAYDSYGDVTASTDALGNRTTLSYAPGTKDVTSVVYADGTQATVVYNSTFNKPTSITDQRGNTTTNTYDPSTGALLTTRNALNQVTTFTYASGRVQSMTDALGHTTTVLYNASGWRQTVIDPSGGRTTYGYDSAGNVTSVTRPDGATVTSTYDADRHLVSVATPGAGTTTYAYTTQGLLSSQTDPTGHATSYVYNAQGEPTAVIDPLGNRTTTVYNAVGEVQATIDVYGNVTTYAYDGAGRQVSVEDQYGHFTTTVFDVASNVVARIDAFGNRTTMVYDSQGRQVGSEDPYGHFTTTVYDAAGNQVASVDPFGNRTTFGYDSAGEQVATEDQYGHFTTTVYDSAGNAVARIDPYGNRTTTVYDSAGRQVATIDAYGHATTTTYNALGQVQATTDIFGHVTTAIYDSLGRQVASLDPYGHYATTVYDSLGRVSASVDVYGNRTTTLYDAFGRVQATQDMLGNLTTTVYDAFGNAQAMIDPHGHAATTVYDGLGRVQASIDVLGNRTTYLYDSFGRQNATEDVYGHYATTVYDSLGRVLASVDALGNRTTYLYDSFGRQNATQDPLGNYATTVYDSLGRVSASVDRLGNRTTTVYDGFGTVQATIDALGHYATTVYDSLGRVVASVDALGNRTTSLYDSFGRQNATQDPLGNLTTTLYDSFGNVQATIDPLGNRTTILYDAFGQPNATENALGFFTTTIYDSLGRQQARVDARGNITTTVYDSFGNVQATIDPLGNRTTTLYDSYGRVAATEDPLDNLTSTVYDSFGNVQARIDPLGNRTTTVYDAYGRQVATIDPLGDRTTNTLDSLGRQVTEIDASNNTTTFAYDVLGRVIETITPGGATTTSAYDALGRLASQTDALTRRIDYGYDADGNNTSQTWYGVGGGSVVNRATFTYDANGHQLTAANNAGVYTLTYDAKGEVTVAQDPWGDRATFSYDGAGHRTGVQDNFSGVTTSVYDGNGNLTRELFGGTGQTPLRIDLAYNANNQLTDETRYADLAGTNVAATTSHTYDADGRLSNQIDRGGGTSIANTTFTYDADGRITAQILNGTAQTFSYDSASQVTADGTNTLTYDATGNRTSGGNVAGTGNQLTTDGTWTYTYDAAGNETKKSKGVSAETWAYGYDDKNELVSAKHSATDGGTVDLEVDYKYDAWGNRIEKDYFATGPGGAETVTRFALDGWNPALAGSTGNSAFNVWADLDGSDALQTRYIHGDAVDQLFARIGADTNAYWLLTDYQGSVRDVVDGSGNVKDTIQYDAFGNIIGETNSAYRGRYAYTGREYDVEDNLQYNRARYYDPATARWMSQDPLGFAAGDSNLYRYVCNRTAVASDPSGMAVNNNAGVFLGSLDDGGRLQTINRVRGTRTNQTITMTYGIGGQQPCPARAVEWVQFFDETLYRYYKDHTNKVVGGWKYQYNLKGHIEPTINVDQPGVFHLDQFAGRTNPFYGSTRLIDATGALTVSIEDSPVFGSKTLRSVEDNITLLKQAIRAKNPLLAIEMHSSFYSFPVEVQANGALRILGEVKWEAYAGHVYSSGKKEYAMRSDATDKLDERTYVRHLYSGGLKFGTFIDSDNLASFNEAIQKYFKGYQLIPPRPFPSPN